MSDSEPKHIPTLEAEDGDDWEEEEQEEQEEQEEEEEEEEEEEYSYSRDETIAAIIDFYDFLAKMYVDESNILSPPASGWPSIVNADSNALAAKFGKSDEVMALLAHVPYIRSPGNWNDDVDVCPNTIFADWQRMIGHLEKYEPGDLRIITEGPTFCQFSAPHSVGLACGGRETFTIVLDTQTGLVYWEDCPDAVAADPCRAMPAYEADEVLPEDEVNWRNDAAVWTIPDFFEVLKDQFRRLHWYPISPHTVDSTAYSVRPGDEGMVEELHDIYAQHGWPDLDRYRKAECLEAIRRAIEERYPFHIDSR